MPKLKRRFYLALTLVLVALALLAWWFHHTTRQALQRAESFNFRRMTVARQDNDAEHPTYRFFYLTNRQLDDGNATLEERFNNHREEDGTLRFGSFDTRIKPALGLGMIINPTDWFTNDALDITGVNGLDKPAFLGEIRAQVEASPRRSLLVIVHGYRNSFPVSLRMTALVAHVLDINTPVLVFDWPGDQGSGLRGYRRAQGVARESGPDLARTIEMTINEIQPERLWLMANSMGAQVVADAFSVLHQNPSLADTDTEIEDVVLTAPDVDRNQFGEQFKNEIAALAKDLTVYVSSNDRALLASRLVNRGRRLGESTFNPRNPDQSQEAAAIANLIDPGSQRITLVDVTPVNRTRNFHNFSLETPEFFDDVYLRLTNEATPRNRLIYPIKTPDGRLYRVLTRGQ